MRKIAITIIIVVALGGIAWGLWLWRSSSTQEPELAPMSTSGSEKAASPSEHNYADIDFAQKMIVHNQQGIQMAEIAKQRAVSEEVRTLAATISDGLTRDSEQYTSWLNTWGERYFNLSDFPEMDGHDMYPTLPGMATYSQMSVLTAASGSEVDKMFLQMATARHEGVIEMANGTEFESMQFGQITDLKTKSLKRQAEEIKMMRQLQANVN